MSITLTAREREIVVRALRTAAALSEETAAGLKGQGALELADDFHRRAFEARVLADRIEVVPGP
jgi:hypothetical protein